MGNAYKYKVGDRWLKGRYMMIKTGERSELLHRHLMEQKIGRKLVKGEVVHHMDGDKLNNRKYNLKIVTAREHSDIHNIGKIPPNKGIPMSDEQKKKLSIARMGFVMSEETKAKISSSLKGKPSSRKGITMSSEQKEKISKSMIKARKEKFWTTSYDYSRRGGH